MTVPDDLTNGVEEYLAGLKNAIDSLNVQEIIVVMDQLLAVYERQGFVYIFGNGGSGATAAHFVNDFNKGIGQNLPKRFRFCCLNDNVPTVLATANDTDYSQVFVGQLRNYLNPGDVVMAISASGNSRNVLEAVEYANDLGAETVALVGFDGGKLKELAGRTIHVPVHDMQKVEDVHLALNHVMMSVLKKRLEGCTP
ncbi:SIS domain-containing protein [Catenuloplanes sp. NPDC051500]|uniref:SIS domain-containing protein n=1 Tax=Catenuloplanes sp. NPDC051500 TaxID=3363959 RepID=UPI0037A96F99